VDEENGIEHREPPGFPLDRPRPALLAPVKTLEMEKEPELLAYWRVIRKRRWTILSILFVLFTAVLIGTLKQTPLYRAKALLEIQKENPNILTVQELFELEAVSDTYLESQYRILESQSLAERVIDQLHLDQREEFNPSRRWALWRRKKAAPTLHSFSSGATSLERDPQAHENVLEHFQKRLNIEPVKRSRLVEVSFESQDLNLAAQVVNTLVSNYIEQNLEMRWEATQKASGWLAQQLVGMKAKLEKSEEELQDYARRNGLLFLETEKGQHENIVNERLRQLQEELTKAQAARYEGESLYRLVQQGDVGALPGVFDNRLMQDLTVRLAELQREYALLSTTFAPDYPRVKQIQSQIDELEGVLARERERAALRITNEYLAATRREKLLRQAFEEQEKQANQIAERSVQYNILKREVDTNKQLYESLLQRLKEAGVSAGLKASNVRIVDPAQPPQKPAKPQVLLNLAMGIVLGLGLGVGGAFLQEYLDNTLKTTEEVERLLHIPALALIPAAESLNHRGGVGSLYGHNPKLLANSEGKTPTKFPAQWYRIDRDGQHPTLSEAFRSLRTSVLLSTAERPPQSLLVSSSQPGEGKTTVSTNLGISLAQLGQRVLIVDSDMRRPSVHKVFEIEDSLGLASYLTGQQDWRAVVRPTGIPGLDALVCGPTPPNPAELLSSERMQRLLREAIVDYNFVVLDSPPLLNVADSRILAALVDGVLLVVKGGETPRELAQRAHFHSRDVGANVIGVVLNNVDVRSGGDYYRYYHYDYYGEHAEEANTNE